MRKQTVFDQRAIGKPRIGQRFPDPRRHEHRHFCRCHEGGSGVGGGQIGTVGPMRRAGSEQGNALCLPWRARIAGLVVHKPSSCIYTKILLRSEKNHPHTIPHFAPASSAAKSGGYLELAQTGWLTQPEGLASAGALWARSPLPNHKGPPTARSLCSRKLHKMKGKGRGRGPARRIEPLRFWP